MEKIVPTYIEDELKKSYLDYAMSVIVGRALPDVRDGLKPVHRRILYAMYKLGLWHNKGFRKCATVVGEVLGKFHPHGDLSVYDALVRMVQDFSLRYPLLQGQGNFGSVDGDAAAAYRYTETRLNQIAELMLKDIDKQTIEMIPTFDGTLEEPSVLPSQFPSLLVNGSSGIAVGMATNIPPHNLNEIVNALVALIDTETRGQGDAETRRQGAGEQLALIDRDRGRDRDDEIDPVPSAMGGVDLLKYVKGPDFPTAGIITGYKGIKEAYSTGKGKITLKADAQITELNKKEIILITEIPYQVNKSSLILNIAELVKSKRIEGISDIRDESDREGIRIIIELKHTAHAQVVLNRLFKHTAMQVTYGIILLALQNGEPKLLTLKALLSAYLDHRFTMVKLRSEFELREAEKSAHILEGLKKAIANIDEVVKIIRKSRSSESAQTELIGCFNFSKEQARAILEMRLSRLVGLEREKLDAEYKEKIKLIKELKHILSSKKNIMSVVKDELLEVKKKFGNPRRTKIVFEEEKDFDIEDLIPDEPVFVTLTDKGYIKRSKSGVYPRQHRAGKGVSGIKLVLEDKVNKILYAKTHSDIIFFTNLGRCYKAKVYELPQVERSGQGKSLANLFPFKEEEKVEEVSPIESFANKRAVIATKKGLIKQMELSKLEQIRKTGIIAISLREGDRVAGAMPVDPGDWIILVTKKGKVIRFKESLLRLTSRTSQGVRGIRVRGEDELLTLEHIKELNKDLLFVTQNGYSKRVPVSKFRATNRGGVGIIGSKEILAGCKLVDKDKEVIITTQNGGTLRTYVKNMRRKGRQARGVKIIRLEKGDKVIDLEVVSI